MRILFLCSSLEPDRDGVGDYTRLLAAECLRQGHECKIIALNDGRLMEKNPGEIARPPVVLQTQESEGIEIACLRCADSLPWRERMERVRAFVSEFDPDFVSLQFVPYGFQRKGIPWRLARDLQWAIAGRPLHIMFHELWIRFGAGFSLKRRMVGTLQRFCMVRMLRTLKPRVVHTSNPTYVGLLKAVGFTAFELPIFGNIPFFERGCEEGIPPQWIAAGLPVDANRADWWLGLFFGTLHPEWTPQPLIGILLAAAKRAEKRLCLVSVGRLGAAGSATWESMKRDEGHEIVFVALGEQPGEKVSTLLQRADFGIAASPWNLIGKSGTASSMLDHGLPVICPRDEEPAGLTDTPDTPVDPLVHRCDGLLESKLVAGLAKRNPSPRLPEIGAGFLAALKNAVDAVPPL